MAIVYVICPDYNTPSGGIMKLYELVDILNQHDIQSFIVHTENQFRVTWFKNSTNISYFESTRFYKDDVIVIPEIWADLVPTMLPGNRKIIFNQNSFNTLAPFYSNVNTALQAYMHKDVIHTIVVSEHDRTALRWMFPHLKLSRIYYGIDDSLFYYQNQKTKSIAFMPRRGRADSQFIEEALKLSTQLNGFSFSKIDNMSIEDCAEILRNSAIFLSFSHKEGFGLPPAEAMACGCIVIGYHGMGGKEFFNKNLCFEIEHSDLMEYVRQVEKIANGYDTNYEQMHSMGKRASEFILKNYSTEKRNQSILTVFKQFI